MLLDQFLFSPALQQWLNDRGVHSLAQMHASFNNLHRITALLYKQQWLLAPFGQSLEGMCI